MPYDEVFELEHINNAFAQTDVAFSDRRKRRDQSRGPEGPPASSIYGMPVLDVDKAKTVLFVKRGLGLGLCRHRERALLRGSHHDAVLRREEDGRGDRQTPLARCPAGAFSVPRRARFAGPERQGPQRFPSPGRGLCRRSPGRAADEAKAFPPGDRFPPGSSVRAGGLRGPPPGTAIPAPRDGGPVTPRASPPGPGTAAPSPLPGGSRLRSEGAATGAPRDRTGTAPAGGG